MKDQIQHNNLLQLCKHAKHPHNPQVDNYHSTYKLDTSWPLQESSTSYNRPVTNVQSAPNYLTWYKSPDTFERYS